MYCPREYKGGCTSIFDDQSFDKISEQLAVYYANNPAERFRVAWKAYTANFISLAIAAGSVGGTLSQFLDMGKRYSTQAEVDIPSELLKKATKEEKFLIKCLPQYLIDTLVQLHLKDIFIPISRRYVQPLWEDLRLLRNLKLVSERELKEANLYQYTLAIGKD